MELSQNKEERTQNAHTPLNKRPPCINLQTVIPNLIPHLKSKSNTSLLLPAQSTYQSKFPGARGR